MKLLIADDQMSLHTFLDKMIHWSSLGITEVKHAYNGKETAELAESYMPDLLIVDIRMPVQSGIDALKSIQNMAKKPKTVILSAYDQFDYAREALRLSVAQYLLKPVDAELLKDTLRELIQSARSDIRAAVVSELEKAIYTDGYSEMCLSLVREAFAAFGIVRYALATVSGARSDGSAPDAFSWEGEPVVPFTLLSREKAGDGIVLLGLTEELEPTAFRELCVRRVEKWTAEGFGDRLSMGLSGIEDDVSALPQKIAESTRAAKMSFYSTDAILQSTGNPSADSGQLWPILEMEKSFGHKAQMGYSTSTLVGSANDLWSMLKSERVDPENVYAICHRMLLLFSRTRNDDRNPEDIVPSPAALRHTFRRFDDLEAYMKQALNRYLTVAGDGSPGLHQAIRKVKKFVEAHFESDLSLQTVADRFAIDKFRLSREFKRQTDENYWHYVTRIRMERAAEFLNETDWKNSRVAERTGYLDESHFSRAFKKHFGMSPKDFRSARPGNRND